MTTTISSKDKDRLDGLAVDIISASVSELLKTKDNVILAIPGGRSVQGIFRRLGEEDNIPKIPWSRVQVFMVDERLVPVDHADSNFRLAKETFLDELTAKGALPAENLHPFITDGQKKDFGILDYEQELKRYGTAYDIVLLSAGEDCHVAALYPDHHSILDESEFYLWMKDSPKPPKERMTLSRKMLLRSKTVVLLFIDKAKKGAYRSFVVGETDYSSCPAKLAQSIENSYVITNLG